MFVLKELKIVENKYYGVLQIKNEKINGTVFKNIK